MIPKRHRIGQPARHVRRTPPARRWTHWAGELRSRYERVAGRNVRVAMRLLRRIGSFRVIVDWRRDVVQPGPQINVAIALFLRRDAFKRIERRQRQSVGTFAAPPRGVTHESQSEGPSPRSFAQGLTASHERHTRTSTRTPANGPSPLMRLVRRLQRTADIEETVLRLMPCGGRRVLRAASRRERIEWFEPQRRYRGQLLRRATGPHVGPHVDAGQLAAHGVPRTRGAVTPARLAFDVSPGESAATGPAIQLSRTLPPGEVNVEYLTERVVREIDRRIVAHRERMGRPF